MRAALSKLFGPYPVWLVLLGTLVYANAVDQPFVFDDQILIVDNRSIRQLWPPGWLGLSPDMALASRPLIRLTLALNYAVGGLEVDGYRLANIALHILAALALFGVLRRTLSLFCTAAIPAHHTRGLAFAAAAIWLAHPLNSECVNYVAQRSESAMALCYLVTLYGATRRFGGGGRHWSWLAVAASVLGMASKEPMATAPLMILIYDRIFVSASWAAALNRHRALYAGLFASWGILAVLMGIGAHGDTVGFGEGVSAYTYALNQSQIVPHYVHLAFWPHPLLLDYGVADRGLTFGAAVPALLVLALLLGAVAGTLVRYPRIGFLGLWFFAILAPTSSFVPIVSEVGAERRLYLPLAALVFLGVLLCYHILRARGRAGLRLGSGLAGAAVLLLGTATTQRNLDYATAVSIWTTAVTAAPQNARAHNNLGVAVKRGGLAAESMRHFQRALRLDSNYADAHFNLGMARREQEQQDEAEWHLRRALAIDPNHVASHHGLGLLMGSQGWQAEAASHHRRAVALDPDDANHVHSYGVALAALGHHDSALVQYRRVLAVDPGFYQAHNNMGIALRALERPQAAVAQYRQALAQNPQFADAHYNLANTLADLHNLAAAELHYRRALELNPHYAKAHNNLGKLLGSKGMLPAAMAHFTRALELKPTYAEAHFNIGMAHFVQGRLEAAITHYRLAVEGKPENPVFLQKLSLALRQLVARRAQQRRSAPAP